MAAESALTIFRIIKWHLKEQGRAIFRFKLQGKNDQFSALEIISVEKFCLLTRLKVAVMLLIILSQISPNIPLIFK